MILEKNWTSPFFFFFKYHRKKKKKDFACLEPKFSRSLVMSAGCSHALHQKKEEKDSSMATFCRKKNSIFFLIGKYENRATHKKEEKKNLARSRAAINPDTQIEIHLGTAHMSLSGFRCQSIPTTRRVSVKDEIRSEYNNRCVQHGGSASTVYIFSTHNTINDRKKKKNRDGARGIFMLRMP